MAFEVVKAMQADGLEWGEGYRPLGRKPLAEIIWGRMAEAVDCWLDSLDGIRACRTDELHGQARRRLDARSDHRLVLRARQRQGHRVIGQQARGQRAPAVLLHRLQPHIGPVHTAHRHVAPGRSGTSIPCPRIAAPAPNGILSNWPRPPRAPSYRPGSSGLE